MPLPAERKVKQMIAHLTKGFETGFTDKNGVPFKIGDKIKTDKGHIGTISFGVYNEKHYGVYVEWDKESGLDAFWLRQDFVYWTKHSIVC